MKIHKIFVCVVLLSVFAFLELYSQQIISVDQLIEGIEDSEFLNPESALVLISIRSGIFDPVNIPSDPVVALTELGFIVPPLIRDQIDQDATTWTSYGEYSFLLTQLFDIPGGIFYSIFPSPHYALKELQFRGFIDSELHPQQSISGSEAIAILYGIETQLANGDIR